MSERIRVDVADMTLGEMAEAAELVGGNLEDAGWNFRQTAALATIVVRRTDPTFTYERALRELKVRDLEIVNEDAVPEVGGGDIGVSPPKLVASGTSVPPT